MSRVNDITDVEVILDVSMPSSVNNTMSCYNVAKGEIDGKTAYAIYAEHEYVSSFEAESDQDARSQGLEKIRELQDFLESQALVKRRKILGEKQHHDEKCPGLSNYQHISHLCEECSQKRHERLRSDVDLARSIVNLLAERAFKDGFVPHEYIHADTLSKCLAELNWEEDFPF